MITPNLRIMAEHDDWLLLRNDDNEPFFTDRRDSRDIADCPTTLLFKLEHDKVEHERRHRKEV